MRTRNRPDDNDRSKILMTYFIAVALLFADQNALAPNLTAIAKDFDLDDNERDEALGGGISLAFFLCGAPASILIGSIIDSNKNKYNHMSRSVLLGVVMLIGESACLMTYFVQNVHQLILSRAFAGFSAGGAIPIVYSVLGDVYARHERARVAAVVSCGVGIGVALGQGVAGYIGSRFGWRISFVIIAIPALICALFLILCLSKLDPPRGMMEEIEVMDESLYTISTCIDEDHYWNDEPSSSLCDTSNNGFTDDCYKQDNSSNQLLRLSSSDDTQTTQFSSLDRKKEEDEKSNNSHYTEPLLSDFRDHLSRFSSSNKERFHTNNSSFDDDSLSLETQQLDDSYGHDEEDNDDQPKPAASRSCCAFKPLADTHFLKPHSVKLLLVQGSVGCLPWGVVNTYLNDYLSEDRGMSVEDATSTMLVFGIGLFFGVVCGGFGAEYAYRIRVHIPIIMGGIANIVGCIPMYFIINHVSETSSIFLIGVLSILAGICLAVNSPIVKSTLTNVTLPTNRGRAFSFLNIFDELGKGLGPMLISLFISRFGRQQAFNISLFGWFISGILNMKAGHFVELDEDRVRKITLSSDHQQHQSQRNESEKI